MRLIASRTLLHAIETGKPATVRAVADDGTEKTFEVAVRIDTPQELEYYRNGGILPYVLRQLAAGVEKTEPASVSFFT